MITMRHNRRNRGIQGLIVISILKVLVRKPMHGYAVFEVLKEIFGEDLPKPLIYMTLRRLEEGGYVHSEWETGEKGPARRVYYITEEGRALLKRKLECVRKFMDICSRILEL